MNHQICLAGDSVVQYLPVIFEEVGSPSSPPDPRPDRIVETQVSVSKKDDTDIPLKCHPISCLEFKIFLFSPFDVMISCRWDTCQAAWGIPHLEYSLLVDYIQIR